MSTRNFRAHTRFQGRHFVTLNGASTQVVQLLTPLNLDARLLAASDLFMNYRFTNVVVHAIFASTNQLVGIGFNTGIATTAPAGYQELMDMSCASMGSGLFGSPCPKLKIGPKILLGTTGPKWFRRGTPYDDTLEVQGQLVVLQNGNFSVNYCYLVIMYTIEFCNPLDAADTVPKSIRPDPGLSERLRQLRLADVKKAQAVEEKYREHQASEPAAIDPVFEKLGPVLVRDGMVLVDQSDLPPDFRGRKVGRLN
jgi:hypothetical protein